MAKRPRVDEQGLAPALALVLRQEPHAHGDAGGAEQLRGQRDHAGDHVGFHHLGADLALSPAVRRHRAIRHHHPGLAAGRELAQDVLQPRIVRVASGRDAVGPAGVVLAARPVLDVEWRVGQDHVGLEVRVQVAGKSVAPRRAQVAEDAMDGQVHLRHPPGALVQLLAVDGDVAGRAVVRLQELLGLHEHAA